MPSATTIMLFAGAALLLLLVPGPAVFYIVARSTSQGSRAGLVSVLGIHTGTVVHVLASVVGLSAILVQSATAFVAVKLVGAAYLIYLGLRALLDHRGDPHQSMRRLAPRSLRRIFVDAVVLNILNPKTAVFFLAFVPQFVDTSRGDAATQLVVLGVVFIALGLASDCAYALAAGWIGERINRVPALARRSNLAAGVTYLGLGLAAATTPSPRQT